jgi:predicted AlkP superfamily phosphohydrolase/phosphomutase
MMNQTILIGLDGATFTVLDPLMADGIMPFLKGLVASGVRARLQTVVPALTPPAWTSLVTGRSPGQHGVFDFFRKVAPESQHVRFNTSHDIARETIWSMANRQGKRVTALNFPMMFPPPPIDGFVVPGWMPWRQLRHGCHPDGLFDRLKALPGFDARELAMDMSMEKKALEGDESGNHEDWIHLHIRRDQQWLQIARTLMREDPCELTAILFDGVDKLQHRFWRYLDPELAPNLQSEEDKRVRQVCLEYFRRLDEAMAEIVGLADGDATLILASDHGFGAQTGTFFVNTWLQQHGYLTWAADAPFATAEPDTLGIDQLARHVYLLDWAGTVAYAPTPSSNGIYIVQNDDGGIGVSPEEYELFRQKLVAELSSFTDPGTGAPVVTRIWTREEAFSGPFIDLAPDLTLLLNDGGLVSIVASDAAYKTRPQPSGTHRLEGVFLATGPGIRQGESLADRSILDVAPMVLHTLGLGVPAELEGRLPLEAFGGDVGVTLPAAGQQATSTGESVPDEQPPAGPELTEEDQIELLRRLRALGYMP